MPDGNGRDLPVIERVRIVENFATLGHTVIVAGRPNPAGPMHFMTPTGGWVKIPEGALDAIVHEYLKVAAPSEATAQHLDDAVEIRNRLLALIEKRGLR